jgi:hypothetical protein
MMKRILSIVFVLFVVAQALISQGFNYQTVLRSGVGLIESNRAVVLTFTIKQGTQNGTVVYSETHNATTNEFGIISVVVGEGTPVTGVFISIDWSNAPYFLNVKVDAEDMGTSMLNSVPYANFAAKSFTSVSADNANGLTVSGAAAGDLLYFNGTNWVRLPKGTDSQVLILESGVPAWKDAAAQAAEPKIGESFSNGIIVGIYPNGDVLVVRDQLILDGVSPSFSYATATSKVAALANGPWRIPTKKEMILLYTNSYVITNYDNDATYWTSTAPSDNASQTIVMTSFGVFNAADPDVDAYRVLGVKKVKYE